MIQENLQTKSKNFLGIVSKIKLKKSSSFMAKTHLLIFFFGSKLYISAKLTKGIVVHLRYNIACKSDKTITLNWMSLKKTVITVTLLKST